MFFILSPALLALLHLAVVPLDLPTPLHTLRFREAVLISLDITPDQSACLGTAGRMKKKETAHLQYNTIVDTGTTDDEDSLTSVSLSSMVLSCPASS